MTDLVDAERNVPVDIRVGPGHAALAGRTGRGVVVAVIDSGVHADHPHVGGVAGGVAFEQDGEAHQDYTDRMGHGTAVTAAIREKAPDAEIYAVKVFGRKLSTSTGVLVRAIDWATGKGARLINLSLGTPNAEHELTLWACVQRATDRGAVIVSPREYDERSWLPGKIEGVAGTILDWTCEREEIRMSRRSGGSIVMFASGYPRPIPGSSPARNLKGVSFSAANVTGILAGVMQDRPQLRSPTDVWKFASIHQPLDQP